MCRAVVPECAGCAMAHPDFGRSVNPISTRGDRLCQPNYYWHTQIFRPSDGPVDVFLKFEPPNARVLNFPKNSSLVLIRLVLINGDCV